MSDNTNRLDEIAAEAEAIRSNTELSATERLDQLKALAEERENLLAEAEATKIADDLANPVTDADDAETVEATDASEATDEQDDATAEADTADATSDDEDATTDDEAKAPEVDEAALAAASVADAPTDNPDDAAPRTITASSQAEGMNIGSPITFTQFARIHRSTGHTKSARQAFGQIQQITEGTPTLKQSDAEGNTAILAAAGDGNGLSIQAAACFCGPDEAVKEIASCSTSGRPVQGVFRTVGVTGRFNYLKSLGIADVEDGVKIWECSDQDAVDPDDSNTWKPCVSLDCQPEVNVEPYAISQCGLISIHTQLSNEQLVDNFIGQLSNAYERAAERNLLDRIVDQSRVFDVDAATIGTNSLLNTLEFVGSQLGSLAAIPNRQSLDGYIALVPEGLVMAIVADQHLRGGGQAAAGTDEILAQLADTLGVSRIVVILDVHTAAEGAYTTAAGALGAEGTPTDWVQGTNNVLTHPVYILKPDSFRAGLSTAVDAGFIRDSELTRRNETQYFFEGLEFLEKVSCHESWVLNITGCPSGVATAPDVAPAC